MVRIGRNDLKFKKIKMGTLSLHSIEFPKGDILIKEVIYGMIANFTPSTPTGRKRLQDWKRKISIQIRSRRERIEDPKSTFAITVGMKFHTHLHGEQNLDLDNYSKPIIDAIAAGLFCNEKEDLSKITNYNQFDDSNFRHLYVERLSDAKEPSEECVVIVVSCKST